MKKNTRKILSAVLTAAMVMQTTMPTVLATEGTELKNNNVGFSASEQTEYTMPVEAQQDTTPTVLPTEDTEQANNEAQTQTEYTIPVEAEQGTVDQELTLPNAIAAAQEVANGGDITNVGLDLSSDIPLEETRYTAGEGYVLVNPKEDGTLELTMYDATIKNDTDSALKLPDKAVTIHLENSNEDKYSIVYASSNASALTQAAGGSLTVDGDGRLDIQNNGEHALVANTLTITGNANLHAWFSLKTTGDIFVTENASLIGTNINTKGNISVSKNASLEASDIIADGTFTANTTGDIICLNILKVKTFIHKKMGSDSSMLVDEHSGDAMANKVYTVYGDYTILDYKLRIEDMSGKDGLNVTAGATLTISPDGSLEVEDDENREGVPKIINKGTLINKGIIKLAADYAASIDSVINELSPIGNGRVMLADHSYTNTGILLNVIDDDFNLRDADSSNDLDTNGYTWDAEEKVLTIENIYVAGRLYLPPDDCTINIQGILITEYIPNAVIGQSLTINGGELICIIGNYNNVTLNGVTMQGEIHATHVLTLKDSNLTLEYLSTSYKDLESNGSITLDNTTLTVNEFFMAEKITMNDTSVIHMNTELINYNKVKDGMSGLAAYLPAGYTLGIYNDIGYERNTIVDSNGEMASNITLKKNTVTPATGGGGGGGSYIATPISSITKNEISVTIKVDVGSATDLKVTLPKAVVDAMVKDGVKETSITSDIITITINLDTIKEIHKQAGSDVIVTATKVSNSILSSEAQAIIGNRPIYDISITDKKGVKITDFGSGQISISIPYTLGTNEKAANVVACYTDGTGKVEEMANSVYDPETKILSFVTDHLSMYGVGYKADETTTIMFSDISGHWAKESIEFVAARGILAGVGDGKFSPDTSMTRGMFVTALGRLAGADVSDFANSSFADVKDGSYYLGFIEWASKNGIVSGTGNGAFAPDQSISREQMAVIMLNYAKAIEFELPTTQEENTFADNDKISGYAIDAVKIMQMAGILAGKDGNEFDPQGTATRAEVSAVLKRFVELLNNAENE